MGLEKVKIIGEKFGEYDKKAYLCNMKNSYETYAHAKAHIRYHLIFSTKFRRECLTEISDVAKDLFMEISDHSKRFRLLAVGVDKNHVHFFVRAKPTISPTQIVQRLKSTSAYLLWQRHEGHLRRFYWKKKPLWTKGYFCATVGEVNEKTIKEYVEKRG